jgi:hypothetical protein
VARLLARQEINPRSRFDRARRRPGTRPRRLPRRLRVTDYRASSLCVRPASRAAASSALLAVSIWNGPVAGRTAHVLDLVGVARGDVSRIDLRVPGLGSWRVYERSAEFAWGAFALGVDLPRSWLGSLQIHGDSGRVATVQLRSSAVGRRLLLPVAKCGEAEPAC